MHGVHNEDAISPIFRLVLCTTGLQLLDDRTDGRAECKVFWLLIYVRHHRAGCKNVT